MTGRTVSGSRKMEETVVHRARVGLAFSQELHDADRPTQIGGSGGVGAFTMNEPLINLVYHPIRVQGHKNVFPC